ncbi:MAG TPA: 3-carboxy-cis,cis-muconate cycloisomerase [Mycobacteriales bacterium]|jgi:3-carboxy-cis,cis-muconate cycloisomerase|nr:3-carboxy-cis,cis-muconate cycloisomerase [Mycobacteriales bacterium]
MRPSSSPSEPGLFEPGLFDGVLSRGGVAAQVDDAAWLRALLDVEAALARAGAVAGLVPAEAAAAITAACAGTYDVAALGRDAAGSGNPVVPLVRAVEAAAGPAGAFVHRGATSQDVLDTAMVLVARRALAVLLADLTAAADAAAGLALRHRDDPVAGRTLMQQALPTTFGLKAAGWAYALDAGAARLAAVRSGLPAQLGGAVGTMSALEGRGPAVLEAFAAELDLAVPVLAWHTLRLPVADLAGALGTAAGVLGKVALDLVLLSQTEVAEVAEGVAGRGGSSTMPHKRNPVAAISARAGALRAPGLVAGLLAGLAQEHERAAGAWHAEWQALSDLLRCTGSAAAWLRDALEHLTVDPARMRGNLAGAALGAEAVAGALTGSLGRAAAHDLVSRAVGAGGDLQAALLAEPDVHLGADELADLLDPARHTGEAGQLVDRFLGSRRPA